MWKALQTIDLLVDGRELKLRKGAAVQLDELTGTALVSGGYVERAADEEPGEEVAEEPDEEPKPFYDAGEWPEVQEPR